MTSGGDHKRSEYGSGPVTNPASFRSATNPHIVLRERRPDVLADREGVPIPVASLTAAERVRFAAQLDAWRAGVALVAMTDIAALTGITVPHEFIRAWRTARTRLESLTR